MKTNNRIVYKPLGTTVPLLIEEEENERADGEGTEVGVHDGLCYTFKRIATISHSKLDLRCFSNLRDLRLILCTLATVLFLVFLFSLSTSNSKSKVNPPYVAYLRSKNPIESDRTGADVHLNIDSRSAPWPPTSDNRPRYDNYLLSVIREREKTSASSKESIDDLQFPDHDQNESSEPIKPWWTTITRGVNDYVTVTNYIKSMKSFNFNTSITLTTQATTEFMYHTLELCKRWDGPISVAVFCPGPELRVAITLIKFLRQCLSAPLSACIRDKVTWHIAYNKLHGLPPEEIGFPKRYLDSKNFYKFVEQDQCPKLAGPEAEDFIKQFEFDLKQKNDLSGRSYRQQFHLTYPINILRNMARQAATTKYILASDIELYPSVNLVPQFINFITKHNIEEEYPGVRKYVFTLPIFEVKANVSAPKTKSELIDMFQKGDAIFFHKWVCDACQNFPNRLAWLQMDKFGEQDKYKIKSLDSDEIVIFEKTQRDKSRDSWEPIFIGTNEDPFYDDRLTWDGRRDKMGQMYEMCLQDYHLFVLGNAFLIHAPGIKYFHRDTFTKRLKYIRENNLIYDETIAKLKKQYENSATINKC